MRFHLAWACVFLLGCGGSDAIQFPDGSTPDGTTTSDTGSGSDSSMSNDTGTGSDAGMDGTSGNDSGLPIDGGGLCGLMPVDGGMGCNTLVASGQAIKANCHGAQPPTAVGGKILDGHYVLTAIDIYNFNGGTCPMETEKIDWVICGNQWETVQVAGNTTSHFNVTALVQSPKLALTITCPPNINPANWTYDVTMSGVVFYLPQQNGTVRASTYTKM